MTLLDAARAYQELMKYRYVFLLGHKGIAETLTLEFTKEAFHHLAGLHKIGIARIRNKKYALDYILENKDVPKIESRDVLMQQPAFNSFLVIMVSVLKNQAGYCKLRES